MFIKKPRIQVFIENSKYIVKTISNKKELKEVLKLRYLVFYEEMLHKKKFIKLDVDKYDDFFDHLVLIHKDSGKIIGTYRINSSTFSKKFYCSTEFDLGNILNKSGVKIELGRTCIHPEHRKNLVILLLWKGLLEYAKNVNGKYLFGVSSVKELSINEILSLHNYFKQYHFSDDSFRVYPKKKFAIKNFETFSSLSSIDSGKLVPNLLKFYLKTGSVICGEPVYDKKLRCYDFFTLLDLTNMNKDVESKLKCD